eukprot:GCRY01002692.1.p1 GENE.GCRY01002692.1~~GCRY01002692.1.p1  ORF type:complete len:107 (+),score=12.42 GCRY01002692.1:194-514(+)
MSTTIPIEENEELLQEAQDILHERLAATGEKERLETILRERLEECGWKEQIQRLCQELIEAKGLEHLTLDDVISYVTPKGREAVPNDVKAELLRGIREFLQNEIKE